VKLGRTQASVGLFLGMGLLLLVAWATSARREAREAAIASVCTCELERQRNGWCAVHNLGYVADYTIRSKALYDALDAHGHDVDVAGMPCESCREAARTDGFCTKHARGFVGGRAYLSRLAYHLARGERDKVQAELGLLATAMQTVDRCELCAAAMIIDGTCPKCRLSYQAGHATPMR
jgi:hypothetical protein